MSEDITPDVLIAGLKIEVQPEPNTKSEHRTISTKSFNDVLDTIRSQADEIERLRELLDDIFKHREGDSTLPWDRYNELLSKETG